MDKGNSTRLGRQVFFLNYAIHSGHKRYMPELDTGQAFTEDISDRFNCNKFNNRLSENSKCCLFILTISAKCDIDDMLRTRR